MEINRVKNEREDLEITEARIVFWFKLVVVLLIVFAIVYFVVCFFVIVWKENIVSIVELIKYRTKESVIYAISWLILFAISCFTVSQIKSILQDEKNKLKIRSYQLAIIMGFIVVIFLFKQPILEEILGNQKRGLMIRSFIFAGGSASGWMIWYLRQLKRYGEFFNIFLLTVATGFCWYARLTDIQDVQLTAVAFLLGSFFHIAKHNLDMADNSVKYLSAGSHKC